MIEMNGSAYYIDFDALERTLTDDDLKAREVSEVDTRELFDETGETLINKEIKTRKYYKHREVDSSKYDIIMIMLEIVMRDSEQVDDSLGIDRALDSKPLNYKIAMNTLISKGILVSK